MKLIQEFTVNARLANSLPIGKGPIGHRLYVEVLGGTLEGERVSGEIVSGGEWALFGPDGFARVDVRLQVKTHDDAFLYIQYGGLLEMNKAVQEAGASGKGTAFEDQYFYTNPRFETGAEQHAWLNTTFFIGQGRMHESTGAEGEANGVEYRIWRPE